MVVLVRLLTSLPGVRRTQQRFKLRCQAVAQLTLCGDSDIHTPLYRHSLRNSCTPFERLLHMDIAAFRPPRQESVSTAATVNVFCADSEGGVRVLELND